MAKDKFYKYYDYIVLANANEEGGEITKDDLVPATDEMKEKLKALFPSFDPAVFKRVKYIEKSVVKMIMSEG